MTVWQQLFGRRPGMAQHIRRPPDDVLRAEKDRKYSGDVQEARQFFETLFGVNDDLVLRQLRVFRQVDGLLMYFSNLVNRDVINEDVIKPLTTPLPGRERGLRAHELKKTIAMCGVDYGEIAWQTEYFKVAEALFRGDTVLFTAHLDEVLCISTRSISNRAISQPQTEQAVRGARDGFIESLSVNITLLRYRLQTPNFRVKMKTVGRLSKTKVGICYIEGLTNPELLEEVEDRLDAIDTDFIGDSGVIEQFIEDNPWSPFPQVANSERPDKCAFNLVEGRVVIVVDGTSFALIVPAVFAQFYQTVDDYSERWLMGTAIRFIRVVSLTFSLIFPALYVSLISFNIELLPTKFAVAVAGGRAGVPFPAVVEVLVMEISMEVLREATIRMPQQVGGALSIVGVLVIGQAAVSAGFASPITVVVVALTTIGSFATPAYNAAVALRMLRFPLTALAGLFGLYGLMIGLLLIANHMLSLRSFGIPYLSPVVPLNFRGLKDTIVRGPLWMMKQRPAQLQTKDNRRIGDDMAKKVMRSPSHTLDPSQSTRRR